MNTLTAAELKRRGMATIEDGLRHGPVHLMRLKVLTCSSRSSKNPQNHPLDSVKSLNE